jgi:hypothetical protein
MASAEPSGVSAFAAELRAQRTARGWTQVELGGGRLIDGQVEVADLTLVMGMLRAAALSPGESLHLMRAIRRDLDG